MNRDLDREMAKDRERDDMQAQQEMEDEKTQDSMKMQDEGTAGGDDQAGATENTANEETGEDNQTDHGVRPQTLKERKKSEAQEETVEEARAKGHRSCLSDNREPGGTFERDDERGHQKGFGKNQGKEGQERSAPHGTRAEGAEHG
jgi:hypothetical protein